MILELTIPSPGESITEALLAKWLVEDGDYVSKDQEVAEVESDKATLPLIAPENGKIKLLFKVGQTVKIGAVAATIDSSAVNPNPTIVKKEAQKSAESPIINHQSSIIKATPVAQKMMDENQLSVEDIVAGLKKISKQDVEIVLQQIKKDEKGTEKNER